MIKHKTKKAITTPRKSNQEHNEKPNFLVGVILILVGIYSVIAMISYFTTGAVDQSILENLRPKEWLNTDRIFTNYCGSLGAILAYFLIDENFGLAAFLIPFFVVISALQLMKIYSFNLWKWFLCITVLLIWFSIAFAKFLTPLFANSFFNPGGNHGLYCMQQIENMIGPPGLIVILLLIAITFFVYLSAETIIIIRKAINPIKYLSSKVKLTVIAPTDKITKKKEAENTTELECPKKSGKENDETTNNCSIENTVVINEEPSKLEDTSTNLTETLKVLPQESETLSGNPKKNDNLIVEFVKEEEKANSKILSDTEILRTPINPREPFTKYKFPTLELLNKQDADDRPKIDMDEIKANNNRIVEVLNSFGVQIKEIKATVGPTITLYEITPAEGVRISKIKNLEDDIALNLSALGIRIIAPIPGKGSIGIEVPNKHPNVVAVESILNSKRFKNAKMALPIALGKTITNDVYIADLAEVPHLLVAGATGQGKSVGLNVILTSLLYKKHPNELKIVLIDPKKVEFSVYSKIADHFMATLDENIEEPIITESNKVVKTLNGLCELMDRRYDLLKAARVRNIKEYNEKFINHRLDLTKGHVFMPYIVVVIDEFGDLIMVSGKEVEKPICRIAQLARAVGIHMIIATQRPTTNIITGTIKANFPGRIAFKVTSQIDSRTILDRKGAEQLIGRGDMLIINRNEPVRVQCAFVDTPEVERINDFISEQSGPVEPYRLPEPKNEESGSSVSTTNISNLDPFFEEAARSVVTSRQGSTSMIQRRFSIGYNRAGRIMDQLEELGIVGPVQGSKPRDVLISDENTLDEVFLQLRK